MLPLPYTESMRLAALVGARLIWVLYVVTRGWNYATAGFSRVTTQEWLMVALLVVGASCVWFKRPLMQVIASVCGIIYTVLTAYQVFPLASVWFQDSRVQIAFNIGPLRMEGLPGVLALFVPLGMLFVFCVILLWHSETELMGDDEDHVASVPSNLPENE